MFVSLDTYIANLALDTFSSLPPKCKPRTRPDGSYEWTPMAAVVLQASCDSTLSSGIDSKANLPENLLIVSLATGTKSIPVSVLPKCNGLILHDCHAEVLALRGLNYWLFCEMQRVLQNIHYESPWLDLVGTAEATGVALPFRLKQGIEISLFTTEAPCGDASMELLIEDAKASGRDTSPWPTTPTEANLVGAEQALPPGRGGFSDLGALRRKPARADAEISMSKSCTDKIMLKQFTGIPAFPLDLFIERSDETYLERLVVYGPQYHQTGYARAFSPGGRLQSTLPALTARLPCAAKYFDIDVLPSNFRAFEFEKRRKQTPQVKSKVSNTSTVWVAGSPVTQEQAVVEVLVNGVKQGYRQFDDKERKGSVLCRKNMVRKAFETKQLLQARGIELPWLEFGASVSYSDLKSWTCRNSRKDLKEAVLHSLGGWPKTRLEDDFEIVSEPVHSQTDAVALYSVFLLLFLYVKPFPRLSMFRDPGFDQK